MLNQKATPLELLGVLLGASHLIESYWKDEEKLVASFGASVNVNPSPSDQQIKRSLVMFLLDLFSNPGKDEVKAGHWGKLAASAHSYDLSNGLFGFNARSEMLAYSRYALGGLVHKKLGTVCYVVEKTPGEFHPFTIYQKIFETEDQMESECGQGGETIILCQCSTVDTVCKQLACVLYHFNGPKGFKTGGDVLSKIPIFYEGRRITLNDEARKICS